MKKLLCLLVLIYLLPVQRLAAQHFNYYGLAYQADSLLQISKNSASASLYDEAFKNPPTRLVEYDLYNAACAHARIGNKDKGLTYLEILVKRTKYHDPEDLRKDEDLKILTGNKRWENILQTAVKNSIAFEAKLNKPLNDSLESIFDRDQYHRRKLNGLIKEYGVESALVNNLEDSIRHDDEMNIKFVSKILEKYGWVGNDLVGYKGTSAMFAVIQHADNYHEIQKKALPLLRKAVLKGTADGSSLAALEDRLLVFEGKDQLYGTQMSRSKEGVWKPFRIHDEANVDIRRASAGLYPLRYYINFFNKAK